MRGEPAVTIAARLREQWTKLAERIYGDDTQSETARGEFISPLITAPLPRGDNKRL